MQRDGWPAAQREAWRHDLRGGPANPEAQAFVRSQKFQHGRDRPLQAEHGADIEFPTPAIEVKVDSDSRVGLHSAFHLFQSTVGRSCRAPSRDSATPWRECASSQAAASHGCGRLSSPRACRRIRLVHHLWRMQRPLGGSSPASSAGAAQADLRWADARASKSDAAGPNGPGVRLPPSTAIGGFHQSDVPGQLRHRRREQSG